MNKYLMKKLLLIYVSNIPYKIINILEKKGEMTIYSIYSIIGETDYKNIHKHIKKLEKNNIVKLKKNFKKQGKPVFVKLK